MLRTVFESDSPRFKWLDLVEPTRADLEEIARSYGLTATAVADCLDPEHLPKFERFNGTSFAILRAHDERADLGADTIQSFTRKVAIFWGPEFLITIHRKDQAYLSTVMQEWQHSVHAGRDADSLCSELLANLTLAVVLSYEPPLVEAEGRVDAFETQLLDEHEVSDMLREMYRLKRRIALAKRLLWRTLSVATRFPHAGDRTAPLMQDLRENAESMHFYADEMLEEVNNLLQMQLSIAAHRTNEVMRILTVFSAFFLPLTFIVGVYGMNFEHMPELPLVWGYPLVWAIMLSVVAGIWIWFRRRGWLR